MTDGDWFVYDKKTLDFEDGKIVFEIVEEGLSMSEAMSHTLEDGKVAARTGDAYEAE